MASPLRLGVSLIGVLHGILCEVVVVITAGMPQQSCL